MHPSCKGDSSLPKKPIEVTFPVTEINRIAEKESTGFGRRHYRPVYTMHKWWARRLGSVFRAIILYTLADEQIEGWNLDPHSLWEYYSQDVKIPGKVILDPMMGGGTTVVEALRFGCSVVAGDLNPVAWFVVKKQIEDINPKKLGQALALLERELGAELRRYYKTTCPDCGSAAQAIYYFYCKELKCTECGDTIPLMRNHFLARSPVKAGDVVVCPQCWDVFVAKSAEIKTKCTKCEAEFVPKATSSVRRQEYECPNNGCKGGKIVAATGRNGSLHERMYAVEFHCPQCELTNNPRLMNGRGYKTADSADLQLLASAKQEFDKLKDQLPIPDTPIPLGVETKRALNHGYVRFKDLFNERQLLNLGKILDWILKIEDWNLKEFLLLAFSNCLKYNNMFAKYNSTRGFITDIFRTHSYSPSMAPVEANCYDTSKGRGAFTAFVNLVMEGKAYCKQPFERIIEKYGSRKVQFETPIIGKLATAFDGIHEPGSVLLQCGSSESIGIPSKSVDAVITDPPYAGNVMYSELSNFFYVWLRIALRTRYDYFKGETVPWKAEVIENRSQKKGKEEFVEGLTRVFSEACRVLKDEGILVFTFHHKRIDAWALVLKAVLNSGFYISASYPVRSEMKASTHLHQMKNITMDMVLVCRKRGRTPPERSWKSIKAEILKASWKLIENIKEQGEMFNSLDVFVMAFGKCLEEYSKHYPNVNTEGRSVSVQEALDSIKEAIESQIRSP